jgi:CelD/BcsL family acetyltransferase involved in cellulose biosynthesis
MKLGNVDIEKKVQVDVYDSFESLQSMQLQWDEFVESMGSGIFLTYDWCRIWWKYYGKNRDLRIFIFRNSEELVGIIPLFFEKIWLGPMLMRVVKIVGSDFDLSQFNLPLVRSYIREIIDKLFELLSKEKWDIFHFGPIAGLYKHYENLRDALRQSFDGFYSLLEKEGEEQTYFELANTWEEYLAGLRKKERQLIRSGYRKIKNQNLTLISELASNENFDQKFKEFENIHRLFWEQSDRLGHFGDWPDSLEFHREIASVQLEHGRLSLLEIRLSDDCFAYQYSYEFGDKCFELLTGRSTSRNLYHVDLGRMLFAEQAKNAIRDGVHYIDSMRGRYEYKLRLGGKLFPIRSVLIYPNGLSVFIKVYIFRIFARLLNLCYYRIWFLRLASKLPFKRKPLRNTWIKTSAFQ